MQVTGFDPRDILFAGLRVLGLWYLWKVI